MGGREQRQVEGLTSGAASQGRPGSVGLTFEVVIPYCLVYLKSRGRVLLIRKAKGRSHEGEWIGLGGKLEPDEDPMSSAVREFREESGLTLVDPKLRGTLIWIDEVQCGIIHIFTGTRWSGSVSESEEGELRWHSIQGLPALDGLAKHQRLFLDRVLLDDDHFYSAVMVYRDGEMVEYADSEEPLQPR